MYKLMTGFILRERLRIWLFKEIVEAITKARFSGSERHWRDIEWVCVKWRNVDCCKRILIGAQQKGTCDRVKFGNQLMGVASKRLHSFKKM